MTRRHVISVHHLVLLAGLLWLAAGDSASAAIVVLKSTATITGPVVRLKDVAEIVDPDPRLVEQLENIIVTPAPAAGRQMRLPFATIRSRLLAGGVNMAETEFKGSSLVTVRVAEQPTSGSDTVNVAKSVNRAQYDRAEKLVRGAIERQLNLLDRTLGGVNIHVQLNASDVPLIISGYVSGYEVRNIDPYSRVNQQVLLRVADRDKKPYEIHVGCRIEPHPIVLVAKHTITRGQVIRAGDVTSRQVEYGEGFLTRLEEVENSEATRTIRAGDPIRQDDVQAVPLVRSGDIVTVTSRHGAVRVSKPMKARSGGSLGETIKLVHLDSREEVTARVVGVREAETLASHSPLPQIVGDYGRPVDYRQPAARTPTARIPGRNTGFQRTRPARLGRLNERPYGNRK